MNFSKIEETFVPVIFRNLHNLIYFYIFQLLVSILHCLFSSFDFQIGFELFELLIFIFQKNLANCKFLEKNFFHFFRV